MTYETSPSTSTGSVRRLTLPKIGFGTARLGGNRFPNRSKREYFLSALRSTFELGYTHFDTAETYARGYAEELIGHAIRELKIEREKNFITSKVALGHLSYNKTLRACENSLRRLGTEYLDLYLIHFPNPFASLKETFRALNQLVREGKVRNLGVSNFNLKQLKNAQSLSETPIITNQVPYNIFFRAFAQNGVLEYCQQNDILLTAYMPVKINSKGIRTNSIIQSVAQAHRVTPYQIALAWLAAQPRVITIPQSFNPQHQEENLEAAQIELTQVEMDQLNRLG